MNPLRLIARRVTLATLLMLTGCTNFVLLNPSTNPRNPQGAASVSIPFGKGIVQAWTRRSPALAEGATPQAYVLTFIGNGSRAESDVNRQARFWAADPVEIWSINYPGYGGSTGPADMDSIAPSSFAAYDFLAQRGRPIIVAGQSLGCAAALAVVAHRPAAGVVLQSPPPLRELIMGNFGWWNLWLLATPIAMGVPADLDSIANAKAARCPAVFIITGADDVVPRRYQERVLAAYAGPKQTIVLPDNGHNSVLSDDQVAALRGLLLPLLSAAPTTVQSPP